MSQVTWDTTLELVEKSVKAVRAMKAVVDAQGSGVLPTAEEALDATLLVFGEACKEQQAARKALLERKAADESQTEMDIETKFWTNANDFAVDAWQGEDGVVTRLQPGEKMALKGDADVQFLAAGAAVAPGSEGDGTKATGGKKRGAKAAKPSDPTVPAEQPVDAEAPALEGATSGA